MGQQQQRQQRLFPSTHIFLWNLFLPSTVEKGKTVLMISPYSTVAVFSYFPLPTYKRRRQQ